MPLDRLYRELLVFGKASCVSVVVDMALQKLQISNVTVMQQNLAPLLPPPVAPPFLHEKSERERRDTSIFDCSHKNSRLYSHSL